jgi:hypothetical protein
VLQRVCAAALHHLDGRARLINYRQLPAAVWAEIAAHFSVEYSTADLAAMYQVAQFDAKNPSLTFTSATQDKERAASADLRRLAEEGLLPVYAALEARRRQEEAEGIEHA